MNAREAARVEPRLELGQRVVDHVLVAVDDGEGQLVLRREMTDPRDLEHFRALADPRRDPLQPAVRRELSGQLPRERAHVRPRLAREPRQLVERLVETLGRDRLEQVIDRVHAERLDRVSIVGGGEHHGGRGVQLLEQLKAGQAGHLDVEKQHLDRMAAEEFERALRIGRRPDDGDAAGGSEQPRQALHRQPFIVYQIYAHQTSRPLPVELRYRLRHLNSDTAGRDVDGDRG